MMRKSMGLLVLAYALLISAITFLLGPCLIGRDRLAFRDASHFYTPLYGYVAERQQQDWLPLWNPCDLTGIPLVGETTTAVFYPIRIAIYALAPQAEAGLAWYVALHLLIAAMAVHIAARSAGAGPLGCAASVIAYPLSGPIFFLIYNPPFLVGAAWSPLMIAGVIRLLRKPDRYWVVATSLAMAFAILGGDPQIVIHVMLIGSVYTIVNLVRHWTGTQRLRRHALISAFKSVALGASLAAPQLAATIDWSLQSSRLSDIATGNQNTNQTNGRLDFGVPPWHWLELVIPEASGRLFPVYTRLSHLIPGDGRTWVVTLSAGLLLLIGTLHRYLARSLRTFDLWDQLVPIGLLFSLGTVFATLCEIVPGYGAFRYPGKWTVFLPLGMTVITARQLDRLVRFPRQSIEWICSAIATLCLTVAAFFVYLPRFGRLTSFDKIDLSDRFWGELQGNLGCEIVIRSALHSVVVAAVLWALFRFVRTRLADLKSIQASMSIAPSIALLCVVAFEMVWIAIPQVATVNRADEQTLLFGYASESNKNASDISEVQRFIRKSQAPAWPVEWRQAAEPRIRMLEVEVSQRGTRFGRWHLARQESLFNSAPSIIPRQIDLFWKAMKELSKHGSADRSPIEWDKIERWLGIDRQWISSGVSLTDNEIANVSPLYPNTLHLSRLVVSPSLETPFCVWEPQWRGVSVASPLTIQSMQDRLREVITNNEARPVVEGKSSKPPSNKGSMAATAELELIEYSEEKIVIHGDAPQAGLLTIKSFQDGNWHVELTPRADASEDSAVETLRDDAVRVDYLFMGAKVPAGQWEVVFVYRPWWLTPSLIISGCGMLAIGLTLRKLVKSHPA